MDSSYHSENLANHCRICGSPFPRGCKDMKAKGDIQILVKACYNIDVSRENHEIYPEHVCLKCFAQMCRIKTAKGRRYINPAVVLFDWQPHNDSCEVCEHFSKCGRPQKKLEKLRACCRRDDISNCCPSCGVTSAHFRKCPSTVVDLLGNLRVKCSEGCHLSFPLHQLAIKSVAALSMCHHQPCRMLHLGKCPHHHWIHHCAQRSNGYAHASSSVPYRRVLISPH